MDLERSNNKILVSIPAGTESITCRLSFVRIASNEDENDHVVNKEKNGFGLVISRKIFQKTRRFSFNWSSSMWLLFTACENLKTFRDNKVSSKISLTRHLVTMAFGSLISPHQFKYAATKFIHRTNQYSKPNLFFKKNHLSMDINIGNKRFKLKQDHIDTHRGVVIDVTSAHGLIIYVCLRGNLDEYTKPARANEYTRRFYLQNVDDVQWQPSFSTMYLSIRNNERNTDTVDLCLKHLIQFFTHHSIPIHFGSIQFPNEEYIYKNSISLAWKSFTCQYALEMLHSVNCRIYDQTINNNEMTNFLLRLSDQNNDKDLYYALERLRRLAISPENYFLDLLNEVPNISNHYQTFYLDSAFYQMDQSWTNYVRIPWFCFTPTRLIVKPYKFMRSNRVFRYIPNVSQSMAFVEFRDETGSAFLSKELVPFLKHYLENGFLFGGLNYVYLHHAQSQIRNKQFYFYCEKEGGMRREELEDWMGNFDNERLPAKNTARRTQPFSSTDSTIEIDQKWVDIVPDIKTVDGKYNFTDGVGQISSVFNRLVHKAIDFNVDEGGYVSSVLQIRYGGCKGTVAVNPTLDGQKKQLLIRPSMMKFTCTHQTLELCKRSMRRSLCLNREVINLLSYRGISSVCLLTFQLQNILWLLSPLVFNQSALAVLREKVLHVLPWSKIASHLQLPKEPFFRRLLHTTIANNLQQLVARAHIRVPEARYMFGIVDEFEVLEQGQIFVQITNEDGTKIVLEGPVAITKNPCHHPGDLRVFAAVNKEALHHLYDVLVFPQKGSRPHASEISGSDLDGDEYTVIWDRKLIPTTPNASPYDYDSGPAPKPLNRIVTREDRLKVILDICEQDNLGRLSNIHLVLVDKFGIDSEQAIALAGGLSQELDSVKSGQHPYTEDKIASIISRAGTSRPDFMQSAGYEEYQSKNILGKLFRSACSLTNTFKSKFGLKNEDPILVDRTLLHDGYEQYLDFAKELYKRYQHEMLEILGSYGFSNEIDLFCCVESCNMKANERSDIQHTVQKLLKAVFQDIQSRFDEDAMSHHTTRAKAAACYYVAYTDTSSKDKRMLSFPWLFASHLLSDYPSVWEDEDITPLHHWLQAQMPSLLNLLSNKEQFTLMELFEVCFHQACEMNDERMITHAELLLEQLMKTTKDG